MKQTLKIGITVLVVAVLAMSGIALAQATDDNETVVEETAAYEMLLEQLSPLVEDGTITQGQAEAVAALLAENLPRFGHRGLHALQATAEFLGLTAEELREALAEYDTLADLAAANGSSGEELIAFLVSQVEEHLADAVADGRITQEEADERLVSAEDRITEMVNSAIPDPADFPRRPGRGFGPGWGDGPDA